MRNDSLATQRDVLLHYSEIDEDRLHADGERILKPLHLSESEIADLQAFLESLSDRAQARVPGGVGSDARRETTVCTGSAGAAR